MWQKTNMILIKSISRLALLVATVRISAAGNSDPDPSDKCAFTLSSSAGIDCPASQLSDGQIRLNGTEDIATFYISDGKITDSQGRGCIVTGE
jgi:hypothetical protein